MLAVVAKLAVGFPKYDVLRLELPASCRLPPFRFVEPVVVAVVVPANSKVPLFTLIPAVVDTLALVRVAAVATVGEPVEKLGIPAKEDPAVMAKVLLCPANDPVRVFAVPRVTEFPFTVRLVVPVRSELTNTEDVPEATIPDDEVKLRAPPERVIAPPSCAKM
jgi:hypothetical protein